MGIHRARDGAVEVCIALEVRRRPTRKGRIDIHPVARVMIVILSDVNGLGAGVERGAETKNGNRVQGAACKGNKSCHERQ